MKKNFNVSKFIHLHVHSDYSMIDGIAKIQELVQTAKSMNMPSLAITDFTNLFGTVKFFNYAYNSGIKPIIGSDFFVRSEILNGEITEITALASNNIGYKNIVSLISQAYNRGYNDIPIIDQFWLKEYCDGLILLSGAKNGELGKCLLYENQDNIVKCINFYNNYFPDRFYLEIIRTGRNKEEQYLHFAIEVAKIYNLPLVATNDVRFININDFDVHKIRLSIYDGCLLNDRKDWDKYSNQQYMRSAEEMSMLFSDIPEALINSVEIAKRCNVTVFLKNKRFLPKFNTGKIPVERYLIKKSVHGLKKRLENMISSCNESKKIEKIYYDRLFQELHIINKVKFSSYFLIVMEFVQWAKQNNIPVGPGRGSGAGSLVAYALNITDLDPIQFNLLFERFLNPKRISMPDFDIDFCVEKRDLVIDHIFKKYGTNAVSQIITFGKMTARAVIRDVGRVLGYPYGFINNISKIIPLDPGITLNKALISEKKLNILYNTDKEIRTFIDIAKKLEGVVRNISKHAGGIVISPTVITDFAPIYCDSSGKNPVIQFDKDDVEYVGLVKFDFLGLRTLTVINDAINMINKNHFTSSDTIINIENIPLDDKNSFNMLRNSETTAVFQLESHGMKDLIRRMQPDNFEDIIALIALFRPGPLQSGMVDNFIDRKHKRETIYYPDKNWQHKLLEPILKSTYGIILYQEQVMQIAQVLAGYTLEKADMLRVAMGKKKPDEMIKQRSIFEHGASSLGVNKNLATKIFDLLEKFSGYGFNKSHSAAYALISYRTLWLKSNYPDEFMAASMTADIGNIEKLSILMEECRRMKITILPPNVNSGYYFFHVNRKNEIICGMGAIKGVGEGSINSLIEERNRSGIFTGLFDLCERIGIRKINKKALQNLIFSGACDCFGISRSLLIYHLDDIVKSAEKKFKDKIFGQIDMFENCKKKLQVQNIFLKEISPWSTKKRLAFEKESIGFYLTGHPISDYFNEVEYYADGLCIEDVYLLENNKNIKIIGLISSIKIKILYNGNQIGRLIVEDQSGKIEVTLFFDILKKYQSILKIGIIVMIIGKVEINKVNNKFKIIANKILSIENIERKNIHSIKLVLHNNQFKHSDIKDIHSLIQSHVPGKVLVKIYYYQENAYVKLNLGDQWTIDVDRIFLKKVRSLIGNNQVKLKFY